MHGHHSNRGFLCLHHPWHSVNEQVQPCLFRSSKLLRILSCSSNMVNNHFWYTTAINWPIKGQLVVVVFRIGTAPSMCSIIPIPHSHSPKKTVFQLELYHPRLWIYLWIYKWGPAIKCCIICCNVCFLPPHLIILVSFSTPSLPFSWPPSFSWLLSSSFPHSSSGDGRMGNSWMGNS